MKKIKDLKNELLTKYQIRKNMIQKKTFVEFMRKKASEYGYEFSIEKSGKIIKNRNIVIGNVDDAEYIFTAHYDTCAMSLFPNVIWLKNPIMYLLYQLFTVVAILGLAFIASLLVAICAGTVEYTEWAIKISLFASLFQMMFGFRNPCTANDNTSGVLTLLVAMSEIPMREREKVAFVFFDNEEIGLVGSQRFNKAHDVNNKCIVNFDCVGEGEHTFFIYNKTTDKRYVEAVTASEPPFPADFFKGSFFTFPSDQQSFANGIGVVTTRKSKLGGYTVGRLHTVRDTVLKEENVERLAGWICGFVAKKDEN